MSGFKETFVNDFTEQDSDMEPELEVSLREVLHLIWQGFVDEYAWVAIDNIDHRFTAYFDTL